VSRAQALLKQIGRLLAGRPPFAEGELEQGVERGVAQADPELAHDDPPSRAIMRSS
jgi:hypothetical protein